MRVISGKYRGKRIMAPKKLPVRPTTDMAKESLFNILGHHFHLDEISFLNLFSGTGNISYEMASRGCEDVTAVDQDRNCVEFIKKMSMEMKFDHFSTIRSEAMQFLKGQYRKWDVIFADPPYEFAGHQLLVDEIFGKGMLAEGGMLILEHGQDVDFKEYEHLTIVKRYGSVYFSFFEFQESE